MFNLSREHITCLYMLTTENLISVVSLDLINLIIMSLAAMLGVGAATSIFDAAVNLGAGLIMNKKQYQQQQALMDKSFEQQLDFWHQQQAYNDPSSQMRRLREAGLNPAMINGNGVNNTAGGLSSVGSPSAPPVAHGNANIAQSAQALQSILKMSEETGYIDTQNQVMAQELINKIIKNEIDTIAKDLKLTESEIKELEKLSNELDFEEKYQFAFGRPSKEGGEMLLNNRLTDYSLKLRSESIKAESEANVNESTVRLNDAHKSLVDAQAEYQRVMTSNADKESKARVTAYLAEAYAANAQAEASKSLSEKYQTEIVNIDQQTWNMMNEEQRKAALHPYEVQLKQIAVEQGQTETEILKLQHAWQDYISARDEDGDFTLSSVFAKFLLENVYVSISPGKGKGKSSE